MSDRAAIIGCGNVNRSDDGVGPYVIELLRRRDPGGGVMLFDAGTDGMEVMYRARGVGRLFIIDARMPEASPGAVYEVPGRELAVSPPHGMNLHDFRWDHALFAGRKIHGDAFPQDVSVFLIEAASVDLGLELSEPVKAAATSVADRILALCRHDRKVCDGDENTH